MEDFNPRTSRAVHTSNSNRTSQEASDSHHGNTVQRTSQTRSVPIQNIAHGNRGATQHNSPTPCEKEISHQQSKPENKAYLMSVLQALRKKQNTEGSAGISSLFGTSPLKSSSSTMTPASRERGTLSSEGGGRPCRGESVSSEYASSSKKMRGLSETEEEAAGLSDGAASGVSRPPSSNTVSTYIAQLSTDIARQALQSESPSSLSSSSSLSATSSPVHRDSSAQQHGSRRQGKGAFSAADKMPSTQSEDSIFDSAHCVMLQELPPPPLPRPSQPTLTHLHSKARRKHHNKPNSYHSEDSSTGEAELGRSWAGLRGSRPPYEAEQRTASEEEDEEDSCPAEAATLSSSDGTDRQDVKPVFDTSHMTVEEILQFIRPPKLSPHVPNNDDLKNFLDPEEIGHLNYLIKCFTDAIFAVALPEGTVGKSSILPVDFLDVYCCCVMRVYFLLFKNLDFMNLPLSEQEALFESGVLKALLCMSFFVFKENGNCWRIPNNVNELNPVVLRLTDLNQILPHNLLQQTLAINIASTKLKFDWPMGMLCICAFFYTPIDVEVRQINKIDKLRDRYMEILLKYLKWKHGLSNASLMFPEILKLMDAIVKHCRKVENLTLRLKDEEVHAFESRLKSLSTNIGGNTDSSKEGLLIDANDSLQSGVSFAKINRRISLSVQFNMSNCVFGSGVEMQHCAAVPTASMYYSNRPLESEEAKSRREVEALLIRKFLQSKQQELPQASPKNDTDHRDSSDVEEGSPVHRVSNMKLLAIRRLLLDISRKEQMPASPEPLGLSPARDDTPSSPRLPPLPAALPLQVVQHKLYQANTLAVAVQQQHLANFAKSLAYRTPATKTHMIEPSADIDDTNAAIDLSRTRQHSPAANLFHSSTITTSLPSSRVPSTLLPKLPALKPLTVAPRRPSPPPPAASYRESASSGAGGSGDRGLAARSELLHALGSSASSGEPMMSQLSVRQIERLLESLGQSKFSDNGNL